MTRTEFIIINAIASVLTIIGAWAVYTLTHEPIPCAASAGLRAAIAYCASTPDGDICRRKL